MATCPAGHQSASDDFCDVCGFRIDAAVFTQTGAVPLVTGQGTGTRSAGPSPGAGTPGAPGGSPAGLGAPAGQPPATGDACPHCGTGRVGQFCEACGYSFAAGQPPAPAAPAPSPTPPWPAPGQAPTGPDLAVPIPPAPAPPTSAQPASAPPNPAPPPPAPPNPAPPPPAPAAPPPPAPAAPQVPAPTESPAPPYPAPSAGTTWTAVVTADRDYFDTVRAASGPDAASISFPAYCPERRFRLSGAEVRVGRRSVSRGIEPEIDLTGPPGDPGVSRLHALLVAAADGTWSVVDPGSANGTFVNGDEIQQGRPVPLRDGDTIHLGAWTALTITRDA